MGAMVKMTIIKAVVVRLMLFLHVALTTWRVVEMRGDVYWLELFGAVFMVLEASYTIYKRNGVEPKWFCPCFLAYLAATLPGIWLLEITRSANFGNINITSVEDIRIGEIHIPIRLRQDTWVLIVEESLLYLMIVARWFLPRGQVTREQLSELLFALIGIASDIMELFSLFDEDVVRKSTSMTYALLGVWSWSVLQFCFVLTAAERPRRAKNVGKARRVRSPEQEYRLMVRVELAAVITSLFMQDGPFLALRLVTMIHYELVTYSLVFFSAKNSLVVLLLLYRLFVMCSTGACTKPESGHEVQIVVSGDSGVAEMEAVGKKAKNGSPRGVPSPSPGGTSELRQRRRQSPAGQDAESDEAVVADVDSFIDEAMDQALGGDRGDEAVGTQGEEAPEGRGGAVGQEAARRDLHPPSPVEERSRATNSLHDEGRSSSVPLLLIPSVSPRSSLTAPDAQVGSRSSLPTVTKLISTVNVRL